MRTKLTKILSVGLAVMGLVHIAATFSPIIAGKLAPLNEAGQQAFTYMSLMCGLLLVVCGAIVCMFTKKVKENNFLCMPYYLLIITLLIDGLLAVLCMSHNPCAWVILTLSLLLAAVNATRKC